jgi:formate dehydrogenase subunit beta
MSTFYTIDTSAGLNPALAGLLSKMLEGQAVQSVMVPTRQPHGQVVAQTLISDPERLTDIDPLAPVALQNAARLTANLTHQETGRPVAVVMRSCEVRAFLELVKLKQGTVGDLILIGADCFGRYENLDYRSRADTEDGFDTADFLKNAAKGQTAQPGFDVTAACRVCTQPVPEAVDLRLCLVGADVEEAIYLQALTDKGAAAADAAGLTPGEAPAAREKAVQALEQTRGEQREAHFAEFEKRTADLGGLAEAVAGCINCYNCRVACPVCYCRECVFVTDTFRHDSDKYLAWSQKWGQIKMPTDTVMFHLTRMLHMSALCVGCGQCSSACPNDIPVMDLFWSAAQRTQDRFAYQPGRSLEEEQPLAVFHAEEFDDVTGQKK